MIFFLGFITGAAAMALVLGLYDVLTRDQIEEDELPKISFNHLYPKDIILCDRKECLIDKLNKMYGTGYMSTDGYMSSDGIYTEERRYQ